MATKRLIKELDAYRREPSRALSRLEPQSDEDLFHLVATLKGPEGTGYEGMRNMFASSQLVCLTDEECDRWSVAPHHHHPAIVSEQSS